MSRFLLAERTVEERRKYKRQKFDRKCLRENDE